MHCVDHYHWNLIADLFLNFIMKPFVCINGESFHFHWKFKANIINHMWVWLKLSLLVFLTTFISYIVTTRLIGGGGGEVVAVWEPLHLRWVLGYESWRISLGLHSEVNNLHHSVSKTHEWCVSFSFHAMRK
jgi:hypothetical protein